MTVELAHVRKFVAALIGAVGVAVAQGVAPEWVAPWLTVVVAFVSALGVYEAPNDVRIRRNEDR